jgi:AcrR family transcriptional regulator
MRKGEATRTTILDRATQLARTVGLEGLTIGQLATELELSKSGLFAHFGSKEALQLAVIEHAKGQFIAEVVMPALKSPRGSPRLRALFERWNAWGERYGGCVFVQLASELDDRPGPARDAVAATVQDWMDTISTAARIAIDEGHIRKDVDPKQLAFEIYGVMMAHHTVSRLLGDPKVDSRARRAFEALLERAEK